MATSPKYRSDTRLGVQFPSYVAPVGVLVAVSIPIFTSQLEKARDATTAANLRSAYAEAMVQVVDGTATATDGTYTITIEDVVLEDTDKDLKTEGENLPFYTLAKPQLPGAKGKYDVTFTIKDDAVTAVAIAAAS